MDGKVPSEAASPWDACVGVSATGVAPSSAQKLKLLSRSWNPRSRACGLR